MIRDATPEDAAGCAALYAPYVHETAITFEAEAPDAAAMGQRIATAGARHAWLVLEDDRRVVGYADGGIFAPRAAYRWSCEVSIYLEMGRRRTGSGRALYEPLLEWLTARGYRMAMAAMTLPNHGSEAFHRALGFTDVGTYRRVGYQHDAWHDVGWVQRPLASGEGPPAEPP